MTEPRPTPHTEPALDDAQAAAVLAQIEASAQRLDQLQQMLQAHDALLAMHIEALTIDLQAAGLQTQEEIDQALEALVGDGYEPADWSSAAVASEASAVPARKSSRRRLDRMV